MGVNLNSAINGYSLPSGFTGPIYSAVNPPSSTYLLPVQMPLQTYTAGSMAISWTWQAFDSNLQNITAYFDDPNLTQPTLYIHAAVQGGAVRNGGPWLAIGTPSSGTAGPPVVLRWTVSDGWPWSPTTLTVLAQDFIQSTPSVFGYSGTLV